MYIANRDEILSLGDVESKDILLNIVEYVLNNIDPERSIYRSISIDDHGTILRVNDKRYRISGKIYVIGIGKASTKMGRAVENILGDLIEDGVIITKYGHGDKLSRLKVVEAGHPVPDENSLKGTQMALDIISRIRDNDLLIFLISGGGSALFEYPEDDITLDDLITVNDLLIRCGASIQEINTVRKHISKVKGGKISKMVKGKIVSLIVSDVVGDPIEFIASGPTARDPTTFRDAYRIAKLYGIWNDLPERVRKHIKEGIEGNRDETLKNNPQNTDHFIVSSNSIACSYASKRARVLNLNPLILTTYLEGEAKDVGIVLGSIAVEVYNMDNPIEKPALLIAGGEATVTLIGSDRVGLGGPNQELILSLSKKIRSLRGVAALSIDTDGMDGPTDAAGGIVDSHTYDLLKENAIDPDEHIRNHDSYNALKAVKSLIHTGATGTNVNSITLILIK